MSSVICNLFLTKLLKVKSSRAIQVENTVLFSNFDCSKSVFQSYRIFTVHEREILVFILILCTVDGHLKYIYWSKVLCTLFIHS